jgi:F-type H+-transporting ATPase subunit b
MTSHKRDHTMFHRILACLTVWVSGVAVATSAWAAETASTASSDINPLSRSALQGDLALWTAIVFLCLLAVLWKFAWKPIAAGLDKREQNVANQIAQAEAANQKAKDILADYERKLAAAEEQVRAIVEQGRQNAEQVGRELIDKAKEDAKAEFQRALKQIDAATSAAIEELASRSATLAVELAGKIVRSKLNPADHSRLIQEAVSGFVQGEGKVSGPSQN